VEKMKLNKEERAIERAAARGEYISVSKSEFEEIARAIAQRRKEVVLNIRMNKQDLENLRKKAKELNVPYQSFISEILHRYAA
jgi:predicted DNA binding CopG/RHH family protein